MRTPMFTANALFADLACLAIAIGIITPSPGQSAAAAAAPVTQPAPAHEVWMAVRTDGKAGDGTAADPFNASTVNKFDALFERFANQFGDNLAIHLGPGVFYGDRYIMPHSNWKIRGAGRDVTILRTRPDPNAADTIGFWTPNEVSGVEVSDITFDFNTPNLRKSNRAFVYPRSGKPVVGYFWVDSLPAWSDKKVYRRGYSALVSHKGAEYICVEASEGKEPVQGPQWSIMRPCDPGKLPAWEKGKTYAVGDAVSLNGKGYLCLVSDTKSSPAADTANWHAIRTDALDPHIYTHAVFLAGKSPSGRHEVRRVKAVNGYGSGFLGREDFIIGLGGDDCVIEDCQMSDFQDDSYGSLIVLMNGQNGVVRNCSVRSAGGYNMNCQAYGGWGMKDATFENNFSDNAGTGINIDSLGNRNITIRGNTFMNCRYVGILVNVPGGKETDPVYTWYVDGKEIKIPVSLMDGLFIHDNLVTLTEDCPYGGVQAQQNGLNNVKIYNNVIRTADGKGHGRRAIGVLGKPDMHVRISNNTCDPDMYCEIGVPAFGWGNVDLTGARIKGLENVLPPAQK
jgi:hypothetical protein